VLFDQYCKSDNCRTLNEHLTVGKIFLTCIHIIACCHEVFVQQLLFHETTSFIYLSRLLLYRNYALRDEKIAISLVSIVQVKENI